MGKPRKSKSNNDAAIQDTLNNLVEQVAILNEKIESMSNTQKRTTKSSGQRKTTTKGYLPNITPGKPPTIYNWAKTWLAPLAMKDAIKLTKDESIEGTVKMAKSIMAPAYKATMKENPDSGMWNDDELLKNAKNLKKHLKRYKIDNTFIKDNHLKFKQHFQNTTDANNPSFPSFRQLFPNIHDDIHKEYADYEAYMFGTCASDLQDTTSNMANDDSGSESVSSNKKSKGSKKTTKKSSTSTRKTSGKNTKPNKKQGKQELEADDSTDGESTAGNSDSDGSIAEANSDSSDSSDSDSSDSE